MWSDIVLSFVTSLADATCSNLINRGKVEKFRKKLETIVNKLFDEFADTSLDNNQFAKIISSREFIELLRNYFFSIRDGLSHSEYMARFEAYICKADASLKSYEVRAFINKIDVLYTTFLYKVIEENVELNAAIQILTESHRELLGKIVESEENLYKYIQSLDKTNIKITDKDILTYHEICRKEFDKIRFTGISGAEDKAVQDLKIFYVENTFSYYSKKYLEIFDSSSEQISKIHLSNFFDYGNKIVLIGAAGLGKSTTLNYLFCNYEDIFRCKALKLKIDLKDYAKDIVENKKDIVWCLATEFYKRIKRTRMSFQDVEAVISEYLDKGECLVILDALDEIPTQSMRNTVRSQISDFCELYYLNRFIISTREVGYLRNKFDDSFLHIKINEFDNAQIRRYSGNWFRTNYKQYDFDEFWNKFEKEVQKSKCSNLVKNPIVLILALVIFDIEKNLPNRRVEFYKKCIDTFLIVREDRKAAFQMTEKIKNILGDDLVVPKIAYYKYEHVIENASYKFTREEVKNAIMEAIEVPDKINWREPVNQYTSYLVNRTELISEIDEDCFDFAHKTFFEYFLAVYFSKVLDSTELVEVLGEWIGDANNDELARLIIEVVIEKNDPKQHKKIIEFMFQQIEKESERDRRTYSKDSDYFRIILDLYKNNMLLPKFHDLYYKCLIYHSKLAFIAERHRLGARDPMDVRVDYDASILAQYFIEEMRDSTNFNRIIDSLYRLNSDFQRQVILKSKDDRFKHICHLFGWIENNIYIDRKGGRYEDIEGELNYFLTDQLNLTLECPQIYVSIVDIIILRKKYTLISKLLECKFDAYAVFRSYTSPRVLYSLVDLAYKSDEFFLLFLILMIKCAKNDTNSLLAYILQDCRRTNYSEKKSLKNKKSVDNVILFWKLLFETENIRQFEKGMLELSIYNEKYKIMYKELYEEYRRQERNIDKRRIIKEIEYYTRKRIG